MPQWSAGKNCSIFHISLGLEHDFMMARRTWLVMEYRSFIQTSPTVFDLGRLDSKTSALGLASGGLPTSAGELKIEQFHRKHLWRVNRGRINGISTEQNQLFLYQNNFSNSAICTKRIQKVVQRVSWVYFLSSSKLWKLESCDSLFHQVSPNSDFIIYYFLFPSKLMHAPKCSLWN